MMEALAGNERYREAIPFVRETAMICQEAGDREGEGMALVFLGAILVDTGEYHEGVTVNQRAAVLLQAAGNEPMADIALQHMRKAKERRRL